MTIPTFDEYVASLGRMTPHVDPTAPSAAATDLGRAAASLGELPVVDRDHLAEWTRQHPAWVPALGLAVGLSQEKLRNSLRHAFDTLGYRRFEWKCDSLNEPSRRAARRLGFRYEGRFRQHLVIKGRNRDTDWFSITDLEWPRVDQALAAWLDDRNFDATGRQRVRLAARPPQPDAPAKEQ